MSLAGKKIVLGVSGGIAAYKTPELVRRLRDRGGRRPRSHDRSGKSLYHPT
ncbi:bifunctional phosphopantothenoylcysteine decarboxylase/phosphopantothenate synthase [Escherichia coli]|uniref:Bifunctional phosphopantothenoylcysteine decarboxylase/phosphopantothenate synthase n=1 Tax=Escherichia coli TaxID=562 RepID=A0A376TPH5_ECOLX|nr:bifunctional phosphopantothenoylcysteine decarboxylase/phosphopantothenate synthase [Escherichia coli]